LKNVGLKIKFQKNVNGRPKDPVHYLAMFFRDNGSTIEDEMNRCEIIDKQRKIVQVVEKRRLEAEARAILEDEEKAKPIASEATMAPTSEKKKDLEPKTPRKPEWRK